MLSLTKLKDFEVHPFSVSHKLTLRLVSDIYLVVVAFQCRLCLQHLLALDAGSTSAASCFRSADGGNSLQQQGIRPKPRVPSLPCLIQRPGSVNAFDISQLFIIENLPKAPNSQKFYQISGELQICHKTDRHQYASSISQFISGPWQLKIPSLELHCSRVPSKHPPQRWRPPQGVAGKHVYACPMHEGFRSYLPLRKNASKSGEE